jgi:hypothetical protein
MKAPVNSTNLANIMDWVLSESGGLGTRNNPLNSSLGTGGPGDGTGGYKSLSSAAHWDALQLMPPSAGGDNTGNSYTKIYNDLLKSASYSQFKADVVASPWAGSHYAGGANFSHSYDSGTQFVEGDQIAQLHHGEMVVRSGNASAMRMNQMSAATGAGGGIVVAAGAIQIGSMNANNPQDVENMFDKFWAMLQHKQAMSAMGSD